MNLNQAAHGDREFGFIVPHGTHRKWWWGTGRMRMSNQTWANWARPAAAWADWQGAKIARFGDNMRDVASRRRQGGSADRLATMCRYGVGDLVKAVRDATDAEVKKMTKLSRMSFGPRAAGPPVKNTLHVKASIEVGLRNFLQAGISRLSPHLRNLHGRRSFPAGCPTV